jgi:two-component system sensor histidine kinase HupT/HoxJ
MLHPKRLARVFYNLAQNASDAMDGDGHVTLRIRLSGQEAVTELSDNGPGLPPELAGRLFEPFATHGKVKGTGLGLSICKRIVEDHGGWLTAENHPAGGAVFTIGLPVASAPGGYSDRA